MNPVFLIMIIVAITILVSMAVVIYNLGKKRNALRSRVVDFVIEQESRIQTPQLTDENPSRELEGSLFQRTVLVWLNRLTVFASRFMPTSVNHEINRKLSMIGSPGGIRAMHFNVIRLGSTLVGIFVGIVWLIFARPLTFKIFLSALFLPILMAILPSVLLNIQVRKAQKEIRLNLPDALDMLSVCSSAGLGFDQALQKVSEYWQSALGSEFRRVVQEIEVGLTRTQALRNMAERLQVAELSSFVAVLVQAEQLGMQIADVLHSQAEQMRILRQFRAKEIANKLPARMMLPLATCILPALIAVILGPMIPQFLRALNVL